MIVHWSKRRGIAFAALMILVLGCGSFARAQGPDAVFVEALQANGKLMHAEEILAPFRSGEAETEVIVSLRPSSAANELAAQSRMSAQAPAEFNAPGAPTFYNLQDRTVRKQLRATVTETVAAAVDRLAGEGMEVTHRFSYQFGFSARVTPEALQRIADDPEVILVEPVRILQPHLAQGIPLMNAAAPRSTYTGAGLSIAICDTGIDTSHPRLGNGGSPIFNAKVIGGYDTGDSDGDPRPGASGHAHGTSCAGIAAGNNGTVGDYIGGVAPGAKLYAVKISTGTTGSATDAAMIAGWEWAITHQDDDPNNPIMIISTSFGGGRYFSTCNAEVPGMTTAAANAVAAGITLFVSSGNDGFCTSMGWPACISYVNSVGAVYDANIGSRYGWCVSYYSCAPKYPSTCTSGYSADDVPTGPDKVTVYSNSASFLTLFAPSNDAYTPDIVGSGGSAAGDYNSSFGGTSAACPYAAGAAAVLQSAAKAKTGSYLTPAQVKQYLVAYGDNVTDGKVAVTKPRVNLGKAVNALGSLPPPGAFPWAMFLPAINPGGGSPPPPVQNTAYWGVDNDVCCTTSSATFSFTLAGVTKTSALASCTSASTWTGWATTTSGPKTFAWQWASAGCGTWWGNFPWTLEKGKYHMFELSWSGSDFIMNIYTATAPFPPQAEAKSSGSPLKDGQFGIWQLAGELVLDLPEGTVAPPKGIFKATK